MTISTSIVTATRSGTTWNIDVTDCNLSPSLSLKDFVVLNTTDTVILSNSLITKTSQTNIAYSGATIGTNKVLQVRRVTPVERFQEVNFGDNLSSLAYNEELDGILKRLYELSVYTPVDPGFQSVLTPLDQSYGTAWSTDIAKSRTASKLYDKFESINNLAFRGTGSTFQAVTNSTSTDVTFPVETHDPANAFNTANHTWTCPRTGTYLFSVSLEINATTITRVLVNVETPTTTPRLFDATIGSTPYYHFESSVAKAMTVGQTAKVSSFITGTGSIRFESNRRLSIIPLYLSP